MKRFLSIITALLMLTLCTAAGAEGLPADNEGAVLSLGTAHANPGDEVTLSLEISGSFAVHALESFINYDSACLEVTGHAYGEALNARPDDSIALVHPEAPGQIKLGLLCPTDPFTAEGVLLDITFRVKEGCGGTLPLIVTVKDFFFYPFDGDKVEIPIETVDGAILVGEYHTVTFLDWDGTVLKTETVPHGGAAAAPEAPERPGFVFAGWDGSFDNVTEDAVITAQYVLIGDVNFDGTVDTVDALMTLRAALDIDGFDALQTLAADIDGSGTIDTADALLILRLALDIH